MPDAAVALSQMRDERLVARQSPSEPLTGTIGARRAWTASMISAVIVVEAQASFEAMPPCTYLPALIGARLSVEPPDVAVDAAAWLAANEALCLLEDAGRRPPHPGLEPRFELLLCALATTFHLLADGDAATYTSLIEALKDARVGARLVNGSTRPPACFAERGPTSTRSMTRGPRSPYCRRSTRRHSTPSESAPNTRGGALGSQSDDAPNALALANLLGRHRFQ